MSKVREREFLPLWHMSHVSDMHTDYKWGWEGVTESCHRWVNVHYNPCGTYRACQICAWIKIGGEVNAPCHRRGNENYNPCGTCPRVLDMHIDKQGGKGPLLETKGSVFSPLVGALDKQGGKGPLLETKGPLFSPLVGALVGNGREDKTRAKR